MPTRARGRGKDRAKTAGPHQKARRRESAKPLETRIPAWAAKQERSPEYRAWAEAFRQRWQSAALAPAYALIRAAVLKKDGDAIDHLYDLATIGAAVHDQTVRLRTRRRAKTAEQRTKARDRARMLRAKKPA